MDKRSAAIAVGQLALGVGRTLRPFIPKRLATALEDRFFGAVFQVTRVTNDNYGYGATQKPAKTD
ncbi:MAG: hypothetical protein ACPGTU_18775 [Myxococcota bacterium]